MMIIQSLVETTTPSPHTFTHNFQLTCHKIHYQNTGTCTTESAAFLLSKKNPQ